jgi:Transcriptional regulator
MNIERLKYFCDLSNTLSYTETAEQNFTTQGNISKQIIALEKELDTTLFSRDHRKTTLTNAGKTLLPYAEKLLADYAALQNSLHPFQESKCEVLKIHAIPVMVSYNVTGLIAQFHQKYPDIQLDVKEVESISLLKEIDEETCDIAYIRLFEMNSGKYEKITAGFDQFAAVLPADHPLAKEETIPLIRLKNEAFFQLDKHTQLYNQFFSLCQKAGFTPNVGYAGTRIDNILDFVSNGMGVSLMMQNSIRPLPPGIIIRPLDITIKSELAFIRPKFLKHSAASNCFWKFLSVKYQSLNKSQG